MYSIMKALQVIKKYPWHFLGLMWILLIAVFILVYSLTENKKEEASHHQRSEVNQSMEHEGAK